MFSIKLFSCLVKVSVKTSQNASSAGVLRVCLQNKTEVQLRSQQKVRSVIFLVELKSIWVFSDETRAKQNKMLSEICIKFLFQLLHLLMLSQVLQLYLSFFQVSSIFVVRITLCLIYLDFELITKLVSSWRDSAFQWSYLNGVSTHKDLRRIAVI